MVTMSKEKIREMIAEIEVTLDMFYEQSVPKNEKDKEQFQQTIGYYLGRKHMLQEMIEE
jgi:hypothetical protein